MRGESAPSTAIGACAGEILAWNPSSHASPPQEVVVSRSERLGCLVKQALALLENDHEAARRCLKDASALLASECRDSPPGAAVTQEGFMPGGLAGWQAKRALAYIEANLGAKICAGDLADLVAISKSHFSRAFKRSLGVTPMAYVARRRVERAKAMMRSTQEQLSEIALACGFADQSHMTRSFQRCVGTSPGLWRRVASERTDARLSRSAMSHSAFV